VTRASFGDADLDELEAAIPKDQRPMNELKMIQSGQFLNPSNPEKFKTDFGRVCIGVLVLLGGPISAFTFDPLKQTLPFLAGGIATTSFLSSLALIRTYLGWSYVNERLITAILPYEETGWYDGQKFTKPPQVLARHQLLSTYEVVPVLQGLQQSLLIAAVSLIGSLGLLLSSAGDPTNTAVLGYEDSTVSATVYETPTRMNTMLSDDDGK